MRNFIIYFFAVSLSLLASAAYCNVRYDGTGVLNEDISGVRMSPNQAFCKVRHVLRHPDKYDSFCFGSSRVTTLNLERIRDDGKWYNMTYAAGSPVRWLHDIKELLDHGIHVSTLLIGLDDVSWKEASFEQIQADAYKHAYSDWDFSYYMGLLLHMPSSLPDPAIAKEKGSIFDLYDTGRTFSPWIDEQAEQDPEKYRKDPKFLPPYLYPDSGHYAAQLEALREIKRLADANNIKVVFFLNPVVTSTYLSEDHESLRRWRRDIADITDFYDFTGLNDVTTDSFNFLETSHYREITGDRMIDRMMNGAPEEVRGFGALVTKDNLSEHERMLELQQAEWVKSHPQEMEWLSVGAGPAPLPSDIDLEKAAKGAAYAIEVIDGHALQERKAAHNLQQQLVMGGWFLAEGETPRLVLACLKDKDGTQSYMLMRQDFRPELIGKLNGSDDPARAGFFVHMDVSHLQEGEYELSFLVQKKDGQYMTTGPAAQLRMIR